MADVLVQRPRVLEELHRALKRSPVVALLGPRQCGKTTLAHQVAGADSQFFDLESSMDRQALSVAPERTLAPLRGLVILDEVQTMPQILPVLRVLSDRPGTPARFLLLGSASPDLIRGASESLAGRVAFVQLGGFDVTETGAESLGRLWERGGFPRSFLAGDDSMSYAAAPNRSPHPRSKRKNVQKLAPQHTHGINQLPNARFLPPISKSSALDEFALP